MSCYWMTMLMVIVLFAMATMLVPAVRSVSCYILREPDWCTGELCIVAKCTKGHMSGCYYFKTPAANAPEVLEKFCQDAGIGSYVSDTLKFCNCNNCNVLDNLRCEGTGVAESGEGETKGGETGGGEPRAIGTAMVCYHDETVLKRCVGNCLFAKCSSGIHTVQGCDDNLPFNEVEKGLEKECRKLGTSYHAGSLKLCNCNKCNGNIFTCDISRTSTTTTSTATTTTTTSAIVTTEKEGVDGNQGTVDENGVNSVETGETGEGEASGNNAMGQQQGINHVCLFSLLGLVAYLIVSLCLGIVKKEERKEMPEDC